MSVRGLAFKSRMQHRDVEAAKGRPTVGLRKILGRVLLPVAASMDRNVEIVERDCLATPVIEPEDAFRRGHMSRDPAFGIVVPVNDDDADAGACKLCELRHRELGRAHVAEAAIIKIACDENELCLLSDRKLDQILKRPPSRASNTLREDWVPRCQPGKRTIEMDIGRMDEGEGRHADDVSRSSGQGKPTPASHELER